MRAVSFKGKRKMAVSDHPKPELKSPTDAVLRVTTSGICGSDLHMYDGRTPLKEGTVVGHEIMGVIEEVGEAVQSIQEGDRVVLPFNIGCGFCANCHRGHTEACLTANPEAPHAAYGYAGMGPYKGGQAEYVLVPFADFNCLKLPGTPGDEWEDDFLLLSDVFPTGYHATELACVQPGKTVAIFGAGPVGLLAAHSSLIKGASEVYVVDSIPERLAKVEELGATPVDFSEGDPVEQIFELRKKLQGIQESRRPGEEEKMPGVDCVIDAVGYQARDDEDPESEKATQVLENAIKVVNATGNVGIIGVYIAPDPGAKGDAKKGIYPFPIADFFDKGLTMGSGQAPVKKYNEYLRDLIVNGKAHPGRIVSHHIDIDEAPEAYEKFDKRIEGYTKVLIRFEEAA
ncbi:MAG TPA: glutathione-independent formaldehyde dehydrogenase [Candidatus Sulfotelmatobacter sp.]|jgi:glutathione-independent formaldehyde dehydrogenase|nr:glutathione-independent formaldehyde dehydrogenase [Candidatus Sulfotelmatobacter sp.]